MFGTQFLLILLIFTHLIAVILIIIENKGLLKTPEQCQHCNEFENRHNDLLIQNEFREGASTIYNSDKDVFYYNKTYSVWRHLVFTIRNMWYFIHSQLTNLQKSQNIQDIERKFINYIEESGVEYYRVIWQELNRLSQAEGWSSNRQSEAFGLGEIVQNRIDKLQNPDQCHISKVLLCNLTNPYGLASSIHDILWCFIKAYHSGMMLVLDISRWHYEIESWESAFLPLSRTCRNMNISHIYNSPWPGKNDDATRSDLGRLPLDLKLQLVYLFDQPLVWWYGQFIRYLLRPNAAFESYLKAKKKQIGFSSPIVGIHVRRTDKIDNEAKFHDLQEYMYHVEDYYKRMELDNPRLERKVFIATDDPNVITECNSKYQRFTCLSFSESADLAYNLKSRYTNSSVWGSLIDIFLLANCDFLICTFSSGFCRLAFELMYSIQPDASNKVHSLDVEYFYAWKKPPQRIALYSHVPKSPKELWFHKGSIISKQDEFAVMYSALYGKIWNGLLDGFIVKTGEKGLYPIFKTIEHYDVNSELKN